MDVVKLNLQVLARFEKHHLDDILLGFLLVFIGLAVDRFRFFAEQRRQHRAEVQEQRLRVLKATMNTVLDIVNNALTNLQLFRLDAEGTLPEESLASLDKLIAETSSELKRLGDMDSTPEKKMAIGVGIDYSGLGLSRELK